MGSPAPRLAPPAPWAPVGALLRQRFAHAAGWPLPGDRADAVVVLGARVFADGSASLTLQNRVRVASRLVVDGHAPLLVVSGGPGDGGVHETSVMRELALSQGVPESAVLVDRTGISTRATCQALQRIARERDWSHLMVVTSDWHLPRTLFGFERLGLTVRGVPAPSTLRPSKLAWLLLREMGACLELRWL